MRQITFGRTLASLGAYLLGNGITILLGLVPAAEMAFASMHLIVFTLVLYFAWMDPR